MRAFDLAHLQEAPLRAQASAREIATVRQWSSYVSVYNIRIRRTYPRAHVREYNT